MRRFDDRVVNFLINPVKYIEQLKPAPHHSKAAIHAWLLLRAKRANLDLGWCERNLNN